MVYFIQQGVDGPIKIGTSPSPVRRLNQLQTSNPCKLRLIGTIEGSYKEESVLHIMFKDHRRVGEWFDPSLELCQFIEENSQSIINIETISMVDDVTIDVGKYQDEELFEEYTKLAKSYFFLKRMYGKLATEFTGFRKDNIENNRSLIKMEFIDEICKLQYENKCLKRKLRNWTPP